MAVSTKRKPVRRRMPSARPPKTAYELCERVATHIEEDPLRYHQGLWGFEGLRPGMQAPTCGTVCCCAGWIVALHDGTKAVQHGPIGARADAILDLSEEATDSLYYAGHDLDKFRQGTKPYARAGAARLRAWMKQHAAHLKARLLTDVPKVGRR